jgi:hypothetical protein
MVPRLQATLSRGQVHLPVTEMMNLGRQRNNRKTLIMMMKRRLAPQLGSKAICSPHGLYSFICAPFAVIFWLLPKYKHKIVALDGVHVAQLLFVLMNFGRVYDSFVIGMKTCDAWIIYYLILLWFFMESFFYGYSGELCHASTRANMVFWNSLV